MAAHYDVAIVGAGLAGCTAAIMYARAGLQVALIEAHADISTFKRLCTHLIQPSAVPTLQRLGLDREIEEAGGVRTQTEIHTRFGWIRDLIGSESGLSYGYNLRRSELDPLLRRTAEASPGVQTILGARVVNFHRDQNVTRLTACRKSGESIAIEATFVVGADGRHSNVAKLAGLPARQRKHGRFGFFAHFVGVRSRSGDPLVQERDGIANANSQIWLLDPEVAYAFHADSGRTILALMVPSSRREEYRTDFESHLRSTFDALPDGPDLTTAHRVSDSLSLVNYPSIWRKPTGPGIALIGDAAMTADYLAGVGCGWAFQSAEWLVDATVAPLLAGRNLRPALLRYAWSLRSHLSLNQALIASYATGRLFNQFERMMFAAAAKDPVVANLLTRYGTRCMSPIRLFSPALLIRAFLAGRPSASHLR